MIHRRPVVVAAACVALAGCAASASEGPRARPEPGHANPPAAANPTFAYYEVTGNTAVELWTSMRRQAPPEGFGRTLWNVSWTMRWEPMAGVCRITQATVALRTEVRLPRWEPPADAAPELVQQWRTFMDNLRVHENGHLEIAVSAARDIERVLRRVQAPSCAMVHGAGNQAAERVASEFRARERAYDQRTRHGYTQGAFWHPASSGPPQPPPAPE